VDKIVDSSWRVSSSDCCYLSPADTGNILFLLSAVSTCMKILQRHENKTSKKSLNLEAHLVARCLCVWGFLWLFDLASCCQGFLLLLLLLLQSCCGSFHGRSPWWCRPCCSCSCWKASWSPDLYLYAPLVVWSSWVEVYSTPHDPWKWRCYTAGWSLR